VDRRSRCPLDRVGQLTGQGQRATDAIIGDNSDHARLGAVALFHAADCDHGGELGSSMG
jgi:hypothetical protein